MIRKHAILAPSAASRWMVCSKSARKEEHIDDTDSLYAKEGTLAHDLAEVMLLYRLEKIKTSEYSKGLKAIQNNDLYKADMYDYVESFVDYCMQQYQLARTESKDAIAEVEVQIDISDFIPECFGRIDFVVISDIKTRIVDLKYGEGVKVDAYENNQLRTYMLGVIRKFEDYYNIDNLEMTIHQPRLDNIETYETTTAELLVWAVDELVPKALIAFGDTGEFVPGMHCRFCKFNKRCAALSKHNLDLFKFELMAAEELSNTDYAEILLKIPILIKWANEVKEYALQQAILHEVKFEGLKLVAGRSNRVYSDRLQVERMLKKKFDHTLIYKPQEIYGITKLEKNIGKANFEKYVAPKLIKAPGKPTLVSVEDKRDEYSSIAQAKKDFEYIEIS